MAGPDTNFLSGTAKPGPYKTQLPMVEEMQFQDWVRRSHVPFDDSPRSDYDMRGYWKQQQRSVTPTIPRGGPFQSGAHFPDQYKTPYHETFSNESQYATPSAPHWTGDKLFNPVGGLVKDESQPAAQPAPGAAPPGFEYKRKPQL